MSVIIDRVLNEAKSFGAGWQKIKCPRHKLLKPGCHAFKVKPHPGMTKATSAKTYDLDIGGEKLKFRNWVYVKDKCGRKIEDPASFYHPDIPKTYAIEHIYDPFNPTCQNECKRKCLDGVKNVNLYAVKRFSGKPFNSFIEPK